MFANYEEKEVRDEEEDDEEDEDYRPGNDTSDYESKSSASEGFNDEETGDQKRKKRPKRKSRKKPKQVEKEEEELKNDEAETEEERKKKEDSLWSEFCKDLPELNKGSQKKTAEETPQVTSVNKEETKPIDSQVKVKINKVFDFAGEAVEVTEEVDLEEAKKQANPQLSSSQSTAVTSKRSSLGSVLEQIKKPKISTLQKSAIDWKQFKKNEGLEEELDQYKRSKGSFIERQEFLQRSDVRQFEIEKDIRAKRRTQNSGNPN